MNIIKVGRKNYYNPKPNLAILTLRDVKALAKHYPGSITRRKADKHNKHKYIILAPLRRNIGK